MNKKELKQFIKGWREVARKNETPYIKSIDSKIPEKAFRHGWRLAINRMCNQLETLISKN